MFYPLCHKEKNKYMLIILKFYSLLHNTNKIALLKHLFLIKGYIYEREEGREREIAEHQWHWDAGARDTPLHPLIVTESSL